MEEVIHEIKIVETDDGFRIEIKGDKERLRKMLEHMPFGMGMPFGGPFGFGFGFKHGPGGHGPGHEGHRHKRHRFIWKHGPGHGMWGDWDWTVEHEEDDAPPRGV